jgi:two-component system sensor histidine kinase KdpD
LIAVIAVALIGNLGPAVLAAITGWMLLNFYVTVPAHTLGIGDASNAAPLGVFLAVAVVVSLLARNAARRAIQAAAAMAEAEAARPISEADRARTTLLAAVSHDLRTPLAAAKAAVSCLRPSELRLTAEDHNELLATADESLDVLAHLAASLLDMSLLDMSR